MADGCTRCNTEALHHHVGAIRSGDVKLCGECYKAWRALGEKIRLEFVYKLSCAQDEFLGVHFETPPPEEPEITISEGEDGDFESWVTPPESIPVVTPPTLDCEF